jgi:hypothetical protein
MSRRRSRVALALTALALMAAAFAWQCRPSAPVPADEEAPAERLRALGYHAHVEPRDREGGPGPRGAPLPVLAGLYVTREEPADWDDLAAQRWSGRWRGCAVALPHGGCPLEGDPRYLAAGGWLFFGDPPLLDDIARRLGLAR